MLYANIAKGLRPYPNMMKKHLMQELPFMATENILMHCVKHGGDRQTLHEAIRRHSVAAGLAVKEEGRDNDLLDRIAADPIFGLDRAQIDRILAESDLTGLAKRQTSAYLEKIKSLLADNKSAFDPSAPSDVRV